jgi:lipid-binding SYLF domain-containing protein
MIATSRRAILTALAALPLVLAAGPARAQSPEEMTVDRATVALTEIMRIPERGIPPSLLDEAQAIAIVPGMIKAGFVVGARHGRGVLLVRTADGGWSSPACVTITGGGVGFQAGAQATDLVLVFKNRGSLESFLSGRGKFTLGADAAVAAGPVGRQAGAGTDAMLSSEIYSYSRSRGLFAGVSLEGAALRLDWRSTAGLYGEVLTPDELFGGPIAPVPRSVATLNGWLAHYTRAPSRQ